MKVYESKSPLFRQSLAYRPFTYQWANDGRLAQLRSFWIPEKVPMSSDMLDWNSKLTPQEKNLLTQIFRFFTQGDHEVANAYATTYLRVFKNSELADMMMTFGAFEGIHKQAYAMLLDTVGMPESEFQAFTKYAAMAAKHDYLLDTHVNEESSIEAVARSVAIFSAFLEGMQLFSSFAMLLSFPRRGLMNGMGQIVAWSVRDESIHCNYMIQVFKTIIKDHPDIVNDEFKKSLYDIARKMVELEDSFIDLAFEMGDIEGLDKSDVKLYIRYVADRRLVQLGLKPNFGVAANPLPWIDEMMAGVEHANFFEVRATAYQESGDNFGF